MATFPAQPPLALVADDITGACDAGVHFLATGWSVEVQLQPDQPDTGADLLAIATNTRGLTAPDARRVVQELAKRLREAGREVFYKKMDSTLHGQPGVEIDALLATGAGRFALVCPAFPDMGRRLAEGELLLGEERCRTGRHLWTRLREGASGPVCGVSLALLRGAKMGFEMSGWVRAERTMLAFDAEQEEDLSRVVELGRERAGQALLCGSTGLARRLGRALRDAASKSDRSLPLRSSLRGPLLAVIGSRSRVTQDQIRRVAVERGVGVRAVEQAAAVGAEPGRKAEVWTVKLGDTPEEQISAALETLRAGAPRPLFFSGGDTAQCLCRLSGALAIRLEGEIETGFPHGVLRGGWFDGWPVATKAGGFGDAGTLVRAVDFFR